VETKEYPVVWLQGASCSGCAVSVLNSVAPNVRNLLVDPVLPGKHVSLVFQPTVMAGSGEAVMKAANDAAETAKGRFILVVEGSIPLKEDGLFCCVGEDGDRPIPIAESVEKMGRDALAVVALGTCAAFGGIPAGAPNPTGAVSVTDLFKEKGVDTPVVNLPGCPPHPDWFVGTVASVLLAGLPGADDVDAYARPKAYYGQLIHENCPRRASFDEGKFAKKLGDEGCLYEMGCKGPVTYADCPTRRWNAAVSWCIGAGGPCNGCTQPEYPDVVAPLYEKIDDVEIPTIGACWQQKAEG
jgi:hydrogenase small subunit